MDSQSQTLWEQLPENANREYRIQNKRVLLYMQINNTQIIENNFISKKSEFLQNKEEPNQQSTSFFLFYFVIYSLFLIERQVDLLSYFPALLTIYHIIIFEQYLGQSKNSILKKMSFYSKMKQ
eukprot:TRINITY_DN8047_c0_g1_i2.p2 TRINITY_DN8047_c0_g1~~TRINITY_DN8047_c0_g1_i2.p2  ORF type:complete len:123 (+),score=11.37 TRINITY_DN8047_c0_g1_i2:548-916(+)